MLRPKNQKNKRDENTDNQTSAKGALSSILLADLAAAGHIKNSAPKNIRPASLDLTVSEEIYQVEGIFQPKAGETVRQVLQKIKKTKHSLAEPLERQKMYVIRLNEKITLPSSVYAYCNPKSTSGRLDTHVRLIADGVTRYDSLPAGWSGELWISIVAKTFPVKLHLGVSLNQLRLFSGNTILSDLELEIALQRYQLLWSPKGQAYKYDELKIRDNDSTIILTIEAGAKNLGWEGVSSAAHLDLAKIGFYPPAKFFTPVKARGDYLYLKKDSFYILSTHEYVRVPPNLACEMVPMDERSGEFRSHYAGFIDPGWGWGKHGEGKGQPLTLEVRPFEDLIIRRGQPIAKIRFEHVVRPSDISYAVAGSNYVKQIGPRLAKQFKS